MQGTSILSICQLLLHAETHNARGFSRCGRGTGERDVSLPVCLSLHPGTSSLVRLFAGRCGGCQPLSVSDTLVSRTVVPPSPLLDQRGCPGTALELTRRPITFIRFKEAEPAMTPTFQSFPTLVPFLQKKELIMRKSQPRRTNQRDLRRK